MKIKLFACGGENAVSEYQLGLGYLKSNCVGDIEIVKDESQLNDCDMIGLSSGAGGLKEAVDILHSTDIPVIIGGQGTMWKGLDDYAFKHIIHGEGEIAFQRIIDGDNLPKNIKEPNIENLDSLKYPDRGKCTNMIPILTSRGCPYNCHFCSSQKYWGKPRWHSVEYFIDEVEYVLKTQPQAEILYIMDDLFIVNEKRFRDIYEVWMAKGLHEYLEPQGFIRSKGLTLDKAKMMKQMGFRQVRFGAETASDRLLKHINKQETVEDHQKCVDICNEIGLNVCCSLMQYLPSETPEDRRATAKFRMKNKNGLHIAGNYRFQPFPGTHFYSGGNPLEYDWRCRGGSVNRNFKAEGVLK